MITIPDHNIIYFLLISNFVIIGIGVFFTLRYVKQKYVTLENKYKQLEEAKTTHAFVSEKEKYTRSSIEKLITELRNQLENAKNQQKQENKDMANDHKLELMSVSNDVKLFAQRLEETNAMHEQTQKMILITYECLVNAGAIAIAESQKKN